MTAPRPFLAVTPLGTDEVEIAYTNAGGTRRYAELPTSILRDLVAELIELGYGPDA